MSEFESNEEKMLAMVQRNGDLEEKWQKVIKAIEDFQLYGERDPSKFNKLLDKIVQEYFK